MKQELPQLSVTDIMFNHLAQLLLRRYLKGGVLVAAELLSRYSEPHRFYHNVAHIDNLLGKINVLKGLTPYEKSLLQLVAYFHDVWYDPRTPNQNEQLSAEFFMECVKPNQQKDPTAKRIYTIIKDTDYQNVGREDKLYRIFKQIDCDDPLYHSDINVLLDNDRKIMKEFQLYPYSRYRKDRMDFLDSTWKGSPDYADYNLHSLRKYVESYRLKVGLYAGSFSPFHVGHMNVLEQAEKHFDKVIILVATDANKESIDIVNRREAVERILPFHEVAIWNGALADYLSDVDCKHTDVTLIRGLRTGYDVDYETNLRRFLHDADKDIKTIYYICDAEFQHISSSAIRSMSDIDPNFYEKYRPKKYDYARRNC